MDIYKPEADTQLCGDLLIALEGIDGRIGSGIAKAGDAEDLGGMDDLAGTEGLETLGQILPFVEAIGLIVVGSGGHGCHGDRTGAVSYTHLDVYKRQHLHAELGAVNDEQGG